MRSMIRQGKQAFMQFVRRFSPSLHAFLQGVMLLYAKHSYLVRTGYMHSLKVGQPCKADGAPLPWMNYPLIAFLEARLQPDCTLFEYGSGALTLFWAERVAQVISVEHDRVWYEKLLPQLPPNATLLLRPLDDPEAYCHAVQEQNARFDLVIVDGVERSCCALAALDALSVRGVILFDDPSPEFDGAFDVLQARGFRRLDFEGLKPSGFGIDRSAIFYRDGNCLGL